jgi:hypothetical protein
VRRFLLVAALALCATSCSKSKGETQATAPSPGTGGTTGAGGGGGQGAGAGGNPGAGASAGAGPSATDPSPLASVPGHDALLQDTSPKQSQRLMPTEVYIRSYLALFGGLSPKEAQAAAKATSSGLFDSWNDYLSALGLPDYRIDLPRVGQTNALMLATFERLGVALCERAAATDLAAGGPAPDQRVVFTFDTPTGLDAAGFAPRFDQLHRRFLGYPAKLAPPDRQARFFKLYGDTVAAHGAKDAPKKLTPEQSGWAVVCFGLVRHPEFHLY